ncbi:hypothetical protein [Halospeciosus flavus]|uniref:Uncharacterized protein n=1 Tax=Halospeciosus flavus TaxID=3032283 RepID=A0ABD5YWR6_9EURY|nr:hypothetical protein [Halospeciosus flavus]
MGDDVEERDEAVTIAEEYADSECVGELGEVTDVEERDKSWYVEFQTHTFSETYTHSVEITKAVGNVVSHDRSSQFE